VIEDEGYISISNIVEEEDDDDVVANDTEDHVPWWWRYFGLHEHHCSACAQHANSAA
jgi:hypothetical protein